MARQVIRQDTQVRKSDLYDDTLPAGETLESAAESLEDDANGLRSQANRIIGTGNWHDALPLVNGQPASLAELAVQIAGSLNEEEHKTLRHAIHFLEDGPGDGFPGGYFECSPIGPFPTSETWWTDASKTLKILERETTWSGPFPTQEVWRIYEADGIAVAVIVTDTITYSGPFEASRSRSFTV